ncbi:MAG: DNA primase catalytic subunit PriS [Candidatus Micrarchaeota archaeon]|nr:DNA primase catalytic subunit PriS [Candidatus Micrarchaeota archaeon]
MLTEQETRLVKHLFADYYSKSRIPVEDINQREFGFGDFGKKVAFRHKGFRDDYALRKYLMENAPASVSCSAARYEKPEARPMPNKIWLGSELVFDLDASDLDLPCQVVHGRGWTCETCLSSVKQETFRLVEEFLVPDFGIPKEKILINFSGNRGYHVHVKDREYFRLDGYARENIGDYIAGNNIDITEFFGGIYIESGLKKRQQKPSAEQAGKRIVARKGEVLSGPVPTDYGWRGKFARGFISALNRGEEALEKLGIDKATSRRLLNRKADIIFGITNGNWDRVSIPHKMEFWKNVLDSMAIGQSNSIDKNVTKDIYHMLRLPDTLHGDTGLIAKSVGGVSDLEGFEPMKDAIAFRSGTMRVKVQNSLGFQMNGTKFGPYSRKEIELPTYACLYMMLKGVATMA